MSLNIRHKKGLKFVHINCRSLYNKLSQITLLFSPYDIICCSETWLTKDYNDAFVEIPGKKVFRIDRNGRGGGVCIYIDSKIAPYSEIVLNHSYANCDLEIVTIIVHKPGLKHMIISSLYRPPRGNIKTCIDRLQEILSTRQYSKKEFWLFGDFNVDYLDRNQPNLNKFCELFKKFGLRQLITDVTRPGRHKSSCLDWIVTNCGIISEAKSLDIMIADHFAVSIIRKKPREHVTYVFRSVRDYTRYDAKSFTDLLRNKLAQKDYTNNQDPNILWNYIMQYMYEILGVMCPVRRFKQHEVPTPWITADIYREMRLRDKIA